MILLLRHYSCQNSYHKPKLSPAKCSLTMQNYGLKHRSFLQQKIDNIVSCEYDDYPVSRLLHTAVVGLTNLVLATFDDPVANVSPYRMNTSYRGGRHHHNNPGAAAPHNAAESDLGYSTMTPTTHDGGDSHSEQASTCIVEPLLIGRHRYRPPSAASVIKPSPTTPMLPPPPPPASRRSRSRSPSPLMMTQLGPRSEPEGEIVQTVLPTDSPHRVITSAQVHMVDSH